MSQSPVHAATCKGEAVSLEGTQEGSKEHLPSSRQQTAAPSNRDPEETQAVKTQDTGPIAEVHIKGTMAVNPDFASSYRKALNSLT